jgi:hypothetical protein
MRLDLPIMHTYYPGFQACRTRVLHFLEETSDIGGAWHCKLEFGDMITINNPLFRIALSIIALNHRLSPRALPENIL